MKKVGFIFGTRPEVIKCIPVILEAQKMGLETLVVFTGQHREMAKPILEFFGVAIDIDLDILKPGQTLGETSAVLLKRLSENDLALKECDVIMVQGDTTSAFVGGYFCFLNQIKIGHIEAGLRTNNLLSPFPEEGNRQLLSRISNYHYTPTSGATQDLLGEGINQTNIYEVGNTVIDALEIVKERLDENAHSSVLAKYNIPTENEFVLITGHRRENLGNGFLGICSALKSLALKYPELNFVYPVHLNPKVAETVTRELSAQSNIYLIEPQDYVPFVSLMSGAKIIMTDSGGVQEEAPSFGKPIIVMRDTTERPEGIEAGFAKLCGTDSENIIKAFDYFLENSVDQNLKNPYGDGQSSKRILNTLINKEYWNETNIINSMSIH